MSLRITPTSAPLGAFVSGLDVDALSRAEHAQLYQAFLQFGVLVFRGQIFDSQQMLTLSELFGETQLHPIVHIRHKEVPKLIVLSANNGQAADDDDPTADNKVGIIPWHSDLVYTDAPNRGALLRSVVIPAEGGDTGWIDTARVYRRLPDKIKLQIQGLKIIHSYAQAHSKQNMVDGSPHLFREAIHPLVYVHPENDLPVLNISPSSARAIVGLPTGEANRELLDYLIDFACREEEAYRHKWEPDDVVLWDNWRTMHNAYGHRKRHARVMHRTTLSQSFKLGEWLPEEETALALASSAA